jgi:hypothetical protein
MGEANRRLKNQPITWTVGSHHTLIIEWLRNDERKTGTELAGRISSWGSPVELRCCHSARDVLAALYDALELLRTTGTVPVIHLEAHGLAAQMAGDHSGLSGPDGLGGEEPLLWTSMAPLLGQLNLASRFQLLVVGAACFSLNALDGFNIEQVAPFSALVGFRSKVLDNRLLDSMIELYRQFLKGGHGSIATAVEAANRELHMSKGEVLMTLPIVAFARHLLLSYVEHELEPVRRQSESRRMVRVKALEYGQVVSVEEMTRTYRATALRHCQQAVSTWFAYSDVPENRDRFRIDVHRIFEARERAYRVNTR